MRKRKAHRIFHTAKIADGGSLIFNFVTGFDDSPSPLLERLYNFKIDIYLRGSYHFREKEKERERDWERLSSSDLFVDGTDPRTIYLKRTTVVPKNIQLVRRIRGEEGLI